MSVVFSDQLYNLRRAHGVASEALDSAKKWQDDVQRSYKRFIDDTSYLIAQIENECRSAEGRISSAENINVKKHESELSSYESRLRRI